MLYLETTVLIGGKQIPYTLPIQPTAGSFELSPTAPKELLKGGRKGVDISIRGKVVDTLEGIDPNRNAMALAFARELNRKFDLKYNKLGGAPCVQKVCVYPRPIDTLEIMELLRAGKATRLVFREMIGSDQEAPQGSMSVFYSPGRLGPSTLVIKGGVRTTSGFRVAQHAESLLRRVHITAEESGQILYSVHYRTQLGISISKKWNEAIALLSGVSAPITFYRRWRRANAQKRYEREAAIQRELRDIMQGKNAEVPPPSGGFCVVSYDPACLIERAEQRKET